MTEDRKLPVISGGSLREAELPVPSDVAWTPTAARAESPFAQGVRRLRRSTTALIGAGIVAYAEYHYSGFGAEHPEEIPALLTTPEFVGRFIRGDVQILSRHAVGVTGSYEASPEITWSGQWLHNPRDQSGVVAPAMTYTFNDAVSMLGTVYVPYGRPPESGVLRSEYGAAPLSGLLQLRVYF